MENIPGIFQKLRISLAGEENPPNVDEQLPPVENLIGKAIESLRTTEENVLNPNLQALLPCIKCHLEKNNSDVLRTASLLQLVAEISKFENLRQECTDSGLMSCLLDCLEQNNPAIILQTLRAIGNMSCDNNKAREKILDSGGVEKIIRKLKELHALDSKTEDNKLQTTACGLVLNMTLDNELVQKEVVNFGAIPVLLSYIENNSNKTELCSMAVNAIFSLVDLDEGLQSFVGSRGCQIFVKTLQTSSDGSLTGTIGECLMSLSEEEDVRMALVKEKCVDVLQEIISKNKSFDEEDKDLIKKLKVAVDLIILLLGDDPCLELLFAEENNAFVDKILLWSNSCDAYIRNSSPVAIGNIARTETNCIQLVKMDVHKHLVGLLYKNLGNSEKDETQLFVSILSAMKNLAIPVNNKAVLIQSGVLDCTIKFMSSSETQSPLAYKAMSVTRLLVQGHAEAVDTVCSNEACISNIVSLAQGSGIEALKLEASRLLAVLLKNARTSDSILVLVRNDGLPPVVSMIDSSHLIMQNEALVALALAVNALDNDLSDKIDESNLLSNINKVFNAENPEPQTCYNSMAVIEALFIKGLVQKSRLEDSGIFNNLEKLTNLAHETVSQRALHVIKKIKNS